MTEAKPLQDPTLENAAAAEQVPRRRYVAPVVTRGRAVEVATLGGGPGSGGNRMLSPRGVR
jgi:hypothetical protein